MSTIDPELQKRQQQLNEEAEKPGYKIRAYLLGGAVSIVSVVAALILTIIFPMSSIPAILVLATGLIGGIYGGQYVRERALRPETAQPDPIARTGTPGDLTRLGQDRGNRREVTDAERPRQFSNKSSDSVAQKGKIK